MPDSSAASVVTAPANRCEDSAATDAPVIVAIASTAKIEQELTDLLRRAFPDVVLRFGRSAGPLIPFLDRASAVIHDVDYSGLTADFWNHVPPNMCVLKIVARTGPQNCRTLLARGYVPIRREPLDHDAILDHLRPALANRSAVAALGSGRRPAVLTPQPIPLLGDSPTIVQARAEITAYAPHDVTVFLHGETGTGKEIAARAIHGLSRRASRNFVSLDCGTSTPELIAGELFGHRRGAFTSAALDAEGLFHAANGGTLFLDEIGELPLALQAKLLRVLETREVRRIGETRSRPVDVRIITATNANLLERIEAGTFRRDLYYRIAVLSIHLPPLRERPDDVGPLAAHFLRLAVRQHKVPPCEFTAEALDVLAHHSWPGNVRQLRNAMERAALQPGRGAAIDDVLLRRLI